MIDNVFGLPQVAFKGTDPDAPRVSQFLSDLGNDEKHGAHNRDELSRAASEINVFLNAWFWWCTAAGWRRAYRESWRPAWVRWARDWVRFFVRLFGWRAPSFRRAARADDDEGDDEGTKGGTGTGGSWATAADPVRVTTASGVQSKAAKETSKAAGAAAKSAVPARRKGPLVFAPKKRAPAAGKAASSGARDRFAPVLVDKLPAGVKKGDAGFYGGWDKRKGDGGEEEKGADITAEAKAGGDVLREKLLRYLWSDVDASRVDVQVPLPNVGKVCDAESDVTCTFGTHSIDLEVSRYKVSGAACWLSLKPLHARIDRERCKVRVKQDEIVLVLRKHTPDEWPRLINRDKAKYS